MSDRYPYTTEGKIAELLQQDYGTEYDEKRADLDDLVDAVRRDWVGRLRQLRDSQYGPSVFKAERRAVDLILKELDPDSE
jgi:hypothetical protein